MIKSFNEIVREHHQVLDTIHKCYILCCGQKASVALKGLQSNEIHFYCRRCADELIHETNLFTELVKKVE